RRNHLTVHSSRPSNRYAVRRRLNSGVRPTLIVLCSLESTMEISKHDNSPADNPFTSEELARFVIDALLRADVLLSDKLEIAIADVREEIEVRHLGGDIQFP